MIRSCGPPNNTTPGNVGDIYQDINTGRIYRCKDVKVHQNDHGYVTVSDYCPKNEYVWDDMSNDYDEGYADGDARYFGVVGCDNLFQNNTTLTSERLNEILTCTSTAKTTTMMSMFNGCSGLTSIPKLDTSNVIRMDGIFNGCSSLTSVPELDTSKVTSMASMFIRCSSLTSIPELDTSKVTNMASMFFGCSSLTSIPELDTSKVTTMMSMFFGCSNLTSIPELDTSNVINMWDMFNGCSSLTSVPELDTSKVTNMASIFNGCTSLTSLYIHNIRTSIQIGSGTSWGHLLTVDSIIHTIQELCTVSAQQKLTMGSANLAKIADLYCKITDDTNEKLTMELCESTDEGAMTLAEYAGLKNWVFA